MKPDLTCLSCVQAKGAAQTVLLVCVVPNARRTEIVGLHDGALRVRLAAPPVDGKANEALAAWAAEELHVPKRAVQLLRGASSRQKQLLIELPVAQIQPWLVQRLAALLN